MTIQKKIMDLPIPPCELGERAAYKSALREASALAESLFNEQQEKWQQTHTRKIIEHELVFNEKYDLLLAEIENSKIKYMNHDLMAGCMDMTYTDLQKAGIVDLDVPPMMVSDAVIGCVGKLKADLADLKECHDNLLQSDKSIIQQMIAEIRSDYYTDETSTVLHRYEAKL